MEGNIELQKKRQDETNERKNAVEAYVYGLRNQLSDALAPFVTEQEQATVSDKLNQTEVRAAQMTNNDWSLSPFCWEPERRSTGRSYSEVIRLTSVGDHLLLCSVRRSAAPRPERALSFSSRTKKQKGK